MEYHKFFLYFYIVLIFFGIFQKIFDFVVLFLRITRRQPASNISFVFNLIITMLKRFPLLVLLLSVFVTAVAYQAGILDSMILKRWNPASDKEQTVDKVKSLKEQKVEDTMRSRHGVVPTAKARVASTDKETLPYYIVDDGTRINFSLVSWNYGEFLGVGAIRPANGTPLECVRKGVAPNPSIYANGKIHT